MGAPKGSDFKAGMGSVAGLQDANCKAIGKTVFGTNKTMTWAEVSNKMQAESKASKDNLDNMAGWRASFCKKGDTDMFTAKQMPNPPVVKEETVEVVEEVKEETVEVVETTEE